ncbi:MAG: hypothetical protein MI922_12765, partial [Bacteroidales bacterium]|nr:hypothetical protein [Bacteroidales bacterium]
MVLAICLTGCSYKRKITATNVSLHDIYSNNIIFQKGHPIIIKGKSSKSGVLSVRLANIVKYANADAYGSWEVQFPTTNLNKPFDVTVEALDTSIVISNARIGDVYMLIGDGFKPFSLNNHEISRDNNENKTDNRIFTYSSSNFYQNGVFTQNWATRDDEIKSYHNLLGHFIADELATSGGTPIGVINLIVPGLNYQMFHSEDYQILKKIKSLPDSLLLDKITYRKYDDSKWLKTSLPFSMNNLTDKIVWLRKKINISPDMKLDSFNIDFGAVKGDFEIYFNGNKIGDATNMRNENYIVNISPDHTRPWTNILSIRCIIQDSTDGFYDEPVINNLTGKE